MRRHLFTLSLLLATAAGAGAQAQLDSSGGAAVSPGSRAPLTVRGVRVLERVPTIDGRVDEAAWQAAEPVTSFTQMRPSPGEPASERTEVRVIYDDQAIYVAMRMYDETPGDIAAELGRRDASGIHSDWAHVLIDSYHDRRTAFRFSVNPKGVLKDVLHYEDTAEDINWDAVWSAAAARDSLGWTAEFRIPLSQLRFSSRAAAGEEMVWGINFGREIARRGEWSWWSPVLPTSGGMVSQAGELRGLQGIRSGRRLEMLPYSVGRLTRAPGDLANPFYSANRGALEMGGDVRYGITSNLTLSATFNPDFGQVEADPSQVNLSDYETFFSEKRPFFLEGSNIFSFGIGTDDGSGEQLFYSRRIGRAPQRRLSPAGGWTQAPEATTILGAAKVSGKTPGGWTVGLLNALTAPEDGRIAAADGTLTQARVEPLTSYSVFSLSRDFREGRSTVGVLGTATNRRLEEEEALQFLRSEAYVGGVTGRHRFAEGAWEASAWVAGSHIRGSETAISRVQRGAGHYFQRPDASHLEFDPTRTSLSGAAANLGLWKNGGSKLRGGIGGHLRTPGLEVNDLGFQSDADQMLLFANLRYQEYQPKGIFRSWHVGLNPFGGWTTAGELTGAQLGQFTNFELTNLWNGGWWVGVRPATLSTGALRGGPALHRPGTWRYNAWLNSDRRKPLRGSVSVWGGTEDDTGRWDYGVGGGFTFRPSAQLNVSLSPTYNRSENTWQYVAQPLAGEERDYLFARLSQRTLSLTTRLNYTVSPTVSLQFYAQPFVSAGAYEDLMLVAEPRATEYATRFRRLGEAASYDAVSRRYAIDRNGDGVVDYSVADPDFNVKQLRSNAVLRWEYRPGSTLFLVWSQGRSEFLQDGSFDVGRDFGRLLGMESGHPVRPTNVLLLKVNYWLNP